MTAYPHPAPPTRAPRGRIHSLAARAWHEAVEILKLPARYWLATLVIVPSALWLASHYRLNISPSMPWTVARVEYDTLPRLGETMLYEYRGAMTGLPSRTFFKEVAGLPGDRIRVEGRAVWVGDCFMGLAMPSTRDGKALTPIAPGVIPDGYLYAKGEHPASFDSRYRESGLVPLDAVIGVAYPVF
jgi:conjugal transfer pilin signal peptidase TrbI